ncbi:MAG: hypothetical protein JXQ76_02080 [Campylobacterales bacterium]|nr:hypothetical protein [Campylobacterales bacterium]
MKKEIIKIGLLTLVIYSNIAVVSLGGDDRPVDEGRTETLRGGEASENNITIEETNTSIIFRFKKGEYLPITLTISRDGKEIHKEVNENREEILFEVAKEKIQEGDVILIRNRREEVAKIVIE